MPTSHLTGVFLVLCVYSPGKGKKVEAWKVESKTPKVEVATRAFVELGLKAELETTKVETEPVLVTEPVLESTFTRMTMEEVELALLAEAFCLKGIMDMEPEAKKEELPLMEDEINLHELKEEDLGFVNQNEECIAELAAWVAPDLMTEAP